MTIQPEDEVAIEVQHLVKRYARANANAVDDLSFTVQRGEIFGLLGPNGAGKTTTIGVLTTGILPTSGKASLMGIDVAARPMLAKQHIAVVPQQSNLDRSLLIREILTFHASYHSIPRAVRNARANELLSELGLLERSKEKVRALSGGMAQRLMLARALMHEPAVLFLDEPTNNLDPQSRLFLWERIRDLHKRGITILLTTHGMQEADQLCDRIAIMDYSKILVLDTPAELKKMVPGGTFLELHVVFPETPRTPEERDSSKLALLHALRDISLMARAEVVEHNGQGEELAVFRIYGQNAGSLTLEATRAVAQNGAQMRDMHVAHPGLEDVFISLTGRNLR